MKMAQSLVNALVVCAFLPTSQVIAQQTWGGFRFGMTPETLRQAYKQPIHQASGVEITKNYPLTLVAEQPIVVQRVQLTPRFSFDESRGLQQIALFSQRDDPAFDAEVGRHFLEAMAGKYGQPVSQTAACAAEETERVCRTTWANGAQHITLVYRPKSDMLLQFLAVVYELNPADL